MKLTIILLAFYSFLLFTAVLTFHILSGIIHRICEDIIMNLDFAFFFNSILIGTGLAMDAFSVSLANGLNEPCMRTPRMSAIAGIFAFFQCAMPLIGWVCVSTIAQRFTAFQKFIPWIVPAAVCVPMYVPKTLSACSGTTKASWYHRWTFHPV